MLIKCTSQRPGHEDVLYRTGPWVFGEVKDVPDDLARKMLAHGDVYEKAGESERPEVAASTSSASELAAKAADLAMKAATGSDVSAQVADVAAQVASIAARLADTPKVSIAEPVEDKMQSVYDSIRTMSKEQVRGFVQREFGQRLDLRNFKTEDAIRQHAIMLAEQFGVM